MTTKLHVAMYPWLAMSHITSFLRIANKLAQHGHKITFFLPPKTQLKFTSQNQNQNHYPDLITFVTVPLPPVDGLPTEAETTYDIPAESRGLLMKAIDLTQPTIESNLVNLKPKPNIVFYDLIDWIPEIGRKHGFKSILYVTTFLGSVAHAFDALTYLATQPRPDPTDSELFGYGGMTFLERFFKSLSECDAIGVQTCKEMEGKSCDHIEKKHGKVVLTAGLVRLNPQTNHLDERFDQWLSGFEPGEVVYCAFGSECSLDKVKFQEIVLGLELTGRPFLAALKPPINFETTESALPDGFTERTKGRGIVYGGWVQQQLILQHPSIGCFITHCGGGSLTEAMVNKCQIVMVPSPGDQATNAKMVSELGFGVEVEKRGEDGFLSREAVCKAVDTVMDEENEVAREVRVNHMKWREFLLKEDVEESYIRGFIQGMQQLL